MRLLGACAASTAAAAALLAVSGADSAPSIPAAVTAPSPAQVAAPAPVAAAPAPPPVRHVPVPPKPEAVQLPPGPLGIPGAAYGAYQQAADRMALEAPGCGIEWNLVAAVGRIESGHADGGNVDAAGLTLTPIEGPLLDGTLPGNAVIRSGAGFARALGPMQFLPTTWALFGGDASGDGRADVNNLRDAAYGAARYLCSSASGLAAEPGQRVAVFAYNASNAYVDNVVAWSRAYRDRAIPVGGIPDMTAPVAPPSSLPTPLPPAQVVVVGCGTPAASASSRPPTAPLSTTPPATTRPSTARPSTAAPSASRSAAPSSQSGARVSVTVPPGPGAAIPIPPVTTTTVVDCPSAPSGPPSAPSGRPSGASVRPSGPPPSARPSGPSLRPSGSPTVRPAPSSARPGPAPSSGPATPVPPPSSTPVRPPR